MVVDIIWFVFVSSACNVILALVPSSNTAFPFTFNNPDVVVLLPPIRILPSDFMRSLSVGAAALLGFVPNISPPSFDPLCLYPSTYPNLNLSVPSVFPVPY